ncbi:MAG: phosphate ABC transporter substrate-binding protein PstS [Caulobacteraceae bacterium]
MTDPRTSLRRALGAFAAVAALGLAASPALAADGPAVTLTETGSTLAYPLFTVWASEYQKTHPGVRIVGHATGSGAGIAQAEAGAVQIGLSDAYMSDAEARQHPGILNVAMAISALTVNYNLPGLNASNLKLDGPTLAGIYSGKIRLWDDRAIAALNPGVRLPHHAIVPIRRADASGDSFVFTQYLTFSTVAWENGVGFGVSPAWPAVPGVLNAVGNDGVLNATQRTPYSISYLGVSFHGGVAKANLGTALLKSYSGQFLAPNPQTIAAAAAGLGPRTPPDQRLTLVNAPGVNAYPLINYEYAVVSARQPNAATAVALKRFLQWAAAPDEANAAYLEDAHFIPLPAHIWVLTHDQIERIH